MQKLRLLIWKLTVPPEKLDERKQNWVLKQLRRLIRGATGGGYVPPTFWEKVKIGLLLIVIAIGTSMLYFALIFSSFQR